MKYIFELSKEHDTLPKAEIISILNSEKLDYKIIEKNEDILLLNVKIDENKFIQIFERLSFSYFIDSYLFTSDLNLDHIIENSMKNPISTKGSIAVRYLNRSDKESSKKIVEALASIYTIDRKVDLNKPDIEIRAIITNKKVYVGIKIFKIDRTNYEKRKVQNRPFFLPISLHPKVARVLVNISGIKKNEVLLDPFCGTGGILIEAGLIGIKIIGSDIEDKMIKGSKKNLDFYGIKKYKLYKEDIGHIMNKIDKVDCIVTDMPYGKSTTTKGENILDLYNRTFKTVNNLLKDGGKAVVGLSDKKFIELSEEFLSIIDIFKIRAHKSLVRYFVVFEKK